MIAYCKYHGIGLIPWSPLSGGALARPLNAEETPRWKSFNASGVNTQHEIDAEIIKRVDEVAKKRDWAMSQVCTYRTDFPCSCTIQDLTHLTGRTGMGCARRGQSHRRLQLDQAR